MDKLHHTKHLKKGAVFVSLGNSNTTLARVVKGVLRGYVLDENGKEKTTHLYVEGDMVFGNYIPEVPSSITIEALEPCELSCASFASIMALVNKEKEVTDIMQNAFYKLNTQLQSRLIALANLSAMAKYALFLKEYPNVINRVPHYIIANFLGITPTQLSRVRKTFSQQM